MDTRSEKLSLLSEMIAFALVDGELHDREYDFLKLISTEMQIEKPAFLDLFRKRDKLKPIKNEFERIQQFYRLALLMYCDGVLHERENIAIHEIGVFMGLNPFAINRVLKAMAKSSTRMISPDFLLEVFQEQLN
jgi:hypothetical protein